MAVGLSYPAIVVGGVDIAPYARSYQLEQTVGSPPILVVELVLRGPVDLVDQTASYTRVQVGPETAAALVELGWTPPGG